MLFILVFVSELTDYKKVVFQFFAWLFFIDAFATSVGTKARFVLDEKQPRRCPANEVQVEEVYEHDRMTRLEQQVQALMQQFQAFLANQN